MPNRGVQQILQSLNAVLEGASIVDAVVVGMQENDEAVRAISDLNRVCMGLTQLLLDFAVEALDD